MTAAACAYLEGLQPSQIEYAAEIGMEHNLGLTCDPVLGYVMIPCIERNAVGVRRAVDSANLAKYLSRVRSHLVSFDMVVETMKDTGSAASFLTRNRRRRTSKRVGEIKHIIHPFEPVYDASSKVLILGSFPSVVSREKNFYYMNANNRFWKVMEALFQKKYMIKNNSVLIIILHYGMLFILVRLKEAQILPFRMYRSMTFHCYVKIQIFKQYF